MALREEVRELQAAVAVHERLLIVLMTAIAARSPDARAVMREGLELFALESAQPELTAAVRRFIARLDGPGGH